MIRRFLTLLVLFVSLCFVGNAQIIDPVSWSSSVSEISSDGVATLTLKAKIDGDWHVYAMDLPADGPVPTSFEFTKLNNVKLLGKIAAASAPIEKNESAFGGMLLKYYEKTVSYVQKFKVLDLKKAYAIDGQVTFMCCNDQQCLPPTHKDFSAAGSAKTLADTKEKSGISTKQETEDKRNKVEPAVVKDTVAKVAEAPVSKVSDDIYAPVIDQLKAFEDDENKDGGSLWSLFLSGLLGGLIAIFTPCVWPIIPMTVSFFLKSDKKRSTDLDNESNGEKKQMSGKLKALIYGLSVVVIYVGLGLLLTIFFGASALNTISTNEVFNIFLFLLLVVFACSFFGGFELMLPASWSSAIDNQADKMSGVLGILLMACTLVIVSFSCTGPIIGTILVAVSTQTNILGPVIGMLGFSIALAIPFSLLAYFPGVLKSMPRSGSWLNTVKVMLGFFELAFSLKFFSVADQAYGWHILSRSTFIVLWMVIFSFAGLNLLGKLLLPNDDELQRVSVPRLFLALGCFSFAIYLLPGLFGAPLNVISAFAPPAQKDEPSLYSKGVHARFNNYEDALLAAKQEGKPLVFDFTGFGCVNCRKMENAVWTDPEVETILNDKCVLVSLFVDDRTPLVQPETVQENGKDLVLKTVGDKWSYLQRNKFGANAQPFYVMMSADGKVLNKSFAFTEKASDFISYLQLGLKNFSK